MIIDGDKLKVWNAPIARRKLGSATAEDVTLLEIALAVETAARIAADTAINAHLAVIDGQIVAIDAHLTVIDGQILALQAEDVVLQNQITELQQPRYSTALMFGGM